MSVGLLWTRDSENERRQQTLLKRALELDLSTLWTTILWTLWVIYWVDLGDRAVRSEGRPGRQIIRRSKETGESDKRVVFPKMEIFPSFDLVVDPFTRTLYWTSTNTINVTRLGDEDVIAMGPLMVGGANDKPRFLALHAEKQLLVVTMEGGVEHGGRRGQDGDLQPPHTSQRGDCQHEPGRNQISVSRLWFLIFWKIAGGQIQ